MKSLLFINGEPPETIPDLSDYDLIGCTDGAFHYLKEQNFPLEKLDFISGDFDSHSEILHFVQNDKGFCEVNAKLEIIETPDQNKTDFHKALEIIFEKGFVNVDIFGASGGEQDHFLGNLSTAFLFKDKMQITFFDEYSTYFFSPKNLVLENVQGKMISLYPFPVAENITTKGLKWALNNEKLEMTNRIGTRNFAVENTVSVSFEKGDLVVFVAHLPRIHE